MEKFEYKMTVHPNDTFSRVTYFCSAEGNCAQNILPENESYILVKLLNEFGNDGWELIQLEFGTGGVMAFWKRRQLESSEEKI